MPAPTAADGAARAVEEIAVPTAIVVFSVILVYHFYGAVLAGALLVVATIFGLVILISLAKYWNAAYTAGFFVFGILVLVMIPSVLGEIVHPAFDLLGDVIALIAILVIGSLLISKLDLNVSSRR